MSERTIISFDYAVKYMLRGKAEEDFIILGGFLTELIGREVTVCDILESEGNKADKADKTNRVDLKARLEDGEMAVFEFQFHQEIDFFDKVLFGVSKAVVEQVSVGKRYNIKKVYSIIVSYYNLGAKREYVFCGKFGGFRGVNYTDETLPFGRFGVAPDSPKADIHPEYYLILPNMFDEKLRNMFDQWVYVLKKSEVRDDFTARGIKEAQVKLDLMKMTPPERDAYNRFLDNKCSLDNVVTDAREEGRQEGLLEGKREIALNLYKQGVSIDIICAATGLSKEQIEEMIR